MKYGFTPGMGATYLLIPNPFGKLLGTEMLLSDCQGIGDAQNNLCTKRSPPTD